ncbi:phage holin family protein [Carnobacterium maltaromaticum]|uniref:phage holin family protein n=1 Tax=Carnobacterium maltaromaticum TaxID=2751 RepID=UPI0019EE1E30|nr:phage holin family protein [Carnobacterium maltaromaticum]CAD5902463.1 Toxin secretion/phage lysis holin [Carnobacterium maltaromaticum]
MFDYLEKLMTSNDTKILFVITLIVISEILDWLSGTVAAVINPEIDYKSKIGTNGILRKISFIMVLLLFIPVSVLIPDVNDIDVGTIALYVLYLGYLGNVIWSIFENYEKMGKDMTMFKEFWKKLFKAEDDKNE